MKSNLDRTFAALADPTRRAMVETLCRGEANVTELARPFLKKMSLPAVTKHIRVLEKAGLITKTRSAQWRRCALDSTPLEEAQDWMEQTREFWEQSLDRLDEYLKTVVEKKAKGKQHGKSK